MERDVRLRKKIKTVYVEIVRRLIDKDFRFPNGGKIDRQLSLFVDRFTQLCGGCFNDARMVDYCIFQVHKNRRSSYQHRLAFGAFGATAMDKYQHLSSKQKVYVEDKWLQAGGLTRNSLYTLIADREHPQAKYIYMAAEESTKRRFHNSDMGFTLCVASTLLWSPFSSACQQCTNSDRCKVETESRYPELYRIRLEEYDKRR